MFVEISTNIEILTIKKEKIKTPKAFFPSRSYEHSYEHFNDDM